MSPRLAGALSAGWPLWASVGMHVVGIAAVASRIALTPVPREPDPTPVEVVEASPRVPQETPRPPRREPPTPPRLVSRPEPERRAVAPPALLGAAPRRESASARTEPAGTGQLRAETDASSWAIPGAGASGGRERESCSPRATWRFPTHTRAVAGSEAEAGSRRRATRRDSRRSRIPSADTRRSRAIRIPRADRASRASRCCAFRCSRAGGSGRSPSLARLGTRIWIERRWMR